MYEVAEEIAGHAWAWTDVVAWAAGTLGDVCVTLAERFFDLESKLSPY